jgi:hypothetical protein
MYYVISLGLYHLLRVLRITELPIIGEVFEAIEIFRVQLWSIIRHPFKTIEQIDFNDNAEQRRAFKLFFAATLIKYWINIPVFVSTEWTMSLPVYIVYDFLFVLVTSSCIHSVFSMLGSRQPYKVTLSLQCYLLGCIGPVLSLLGLPGKLVPGILFTVNTDPRVILVQFVLTSLMLACLLGLAIVTTYGYAKAHQFSKKRAFVGAITGYIAAFIIRETIVIPFWNSIEKFLARVLDRF